MASENVEEWDVPLAASQSLSDDSDNGVTQELKNYVELMAYKEVKPVKASKHTESLSKPKKRTLADNAKQFMEFSVPPERGERLKRLGAKHKTITVEQLEDKIRTVKSKERRKEDILKRKEEIYYELLTKLEMQCRTQYLNHVSKKFANVIAKLSTKIRVPPKLVDPYARMQRAIFCKILQSIGVEATTQAAVYYSTNEGSEYAIYHKLSHALLSIIIKSLDLASTYNPDDKDEEVQTKMDNDLKDRLMRAAEKKILSARKC